ncbi:MAG: hypothetical protein JW706_10650 [Opitutales bacterium]|nr:hypothetical protein [Opitutales bacterium]
MREEEDRLAMSLVEWLKPPPPGRYRSERMEHRRPWLKPWLSFFYREPDFTMIRSLILKDGILSNRGPHQPVKGSTHCRSDVVLVHRLAFFASLPPWLEFGASQG